MLEAYYRNEDKKA